MRRRVRTVRGPSAWRVRSVPERSWDSRPAPARRQANGNNATGSAVLASSEPRETHISQTLQDDTFTLLRFIHSFVHSFVHSFIRFTDLPRCGPLGLVLEVFDVAPEAVEVPGPGPGPAGPRRLKFLCGRRRALPQPVARARPRQSCASASCRGDAGRRAAVAAGAGTGVGAEAETEPE